ncbi:dihydrofolate reductase [Virgibacillus sp. LDC-1]|uniref:dihydrofolate reductase n=1 Tax=Virgibacillus sp. LDC-1 TaxID=3039856 RepID=UPI0024DE3FFF|nr:dihydrofolate reductase [Virgibacillus sp. LDC-1]
MLSLLVAMDRERVIGANNDLPWHLPRDLKFFKEKTTGNTIIMGRNTFESIGKALPNRRNVVLTRNKQAIFPEDIEVIHDIDTILKWNAEKPEAEYFIIGGGKLFEQMLAYADRMYITMIDETFAGDTYFPVFSTTDWKITSNVKGERDERNPYDYYFVQYDRI